MFNLSYYKDKALRLLKNKKEIIILLFLLFFLLLPRILVYPFFGNGIISTDAELRYIPQVEELSQSPANFFKQTGPLYSLFLLFFKKVTGDMVVGPVFIQHIVGIVSAFLVFYYFRRVNLTLSFIVAIFSFFNPISIWLEHNVLRESFVSFFLILLVILLTKAIKSEKYFKLYFSFLTGILGLVLVFLRIEFLVLVILVPLILLILKKRNSSDFKLKNKLFLKWIFGYFLPFLIIFLIYMALPSKPKAGTSYDSWFNIAYHYLQPEVFYYQDSGYPELLKEYQEIIEDKKSASNSMSEFYTATENYLSGHTEIKLSKMELMDKIYIEMFLKNNISYQRSIIINLANHILGVSELNTLIHKNKITEIFLVNLIVLILAILMIIISWILFFLFLPALLVFLIKWKSLPDEVIIAFLISIIHLLVLTFLSNPTHRFRYGLDPFIYFSQIYLILILIKWLVLKISFVKKIIL